MPLAVTPADRSLAGAQLPFAEQIAFFRGKLGNLIPTRTWRDVTHAAHDTGFMVAGAMKADLLADFAQAVDSAIADGKSLGWFRQAFDAIVEEHGWSHTGGRDWRSRVIYQTNMFTCYAAGRLAQLRDPALQTLAPYWMYVHNDSVMHPRPLHMSWNRLVLPADDPWFKTHYPPNGWGCRCRVTAVSEAQARRDGGRFGPAPDDGINPRTGAPNGIDRGFAYMPGDTVTDQIRQTLLAKADKLPAPIAAALRGDLNDLPALPPAADFVGTVGADFRQAVDAGIASIPAPIRQAVADAGYGVSAGPSLIDIAPRLATAAPPRGHAPWVTWRHLDGGTLGEEQLIAIAEFAILESGLRVATPPARVGALLRHEHGHVFDLATGASRRPEFVAAHAADAASLAGWLPRLAAAPADEIRYLTQSGMPGHQEAFAELLAELYGGGTASHINAAKAMPRSLEAARAIIDAYLKGTP